MVPVMDAKVDLVKFQEQAKNRALEDDVRFVIDGFREGSALVACAIKAMSLFAQARSRQGMAEVGLYTEILSSMSVACGSTALQANDTYSRQLAMLATSQVILLHCASCVRSEAAKRVTATQLCTLFHDVLKQRSYMAIQLTPDHENQFSQTMKGCKASAYFPPGFQHSALALLLVAARVCLEGKLFSEQLKNAAVSTGFCRQLQEIAAENMAVLAGKQTPSFTKRTNSCMWFANMALACLERVTAAHANNCQHLVTSRVKFGSDGVVDFPSVPLFCAQFARIPQLMENQATQLCVATNLQLLMNLTHNTCGSDTVMALGGTYALAHLIAHLADAQSELVSQATRHHSSTGVEDLPETQDILGSVPPVPVCKSDRSSQRSLFEPDAAAACDRQQQITSALCVLVNMVEHSATAGACIAQLDLSADQHIAGAPSRSNAANSPGNIVQEQACCERDQRASPITNSQLSIDKNAQTRLARGSRRRRRNDSRPVIVEAEVQPKALRLGSQQVPTMYVGTGQGIELDHAESFIRFLCSLLIRLWERQSSASCTSDAELLSSVGIVQLYTSILLGVLVHRTPACRPFIASLLHIDRLISDMETGLNFYATHGAIEGSSKLFFQQAIDSLKAEV
eukprot:jgi/Ulvmu1/1717/UM116_0031.1